MIATHHFNMKQKQLDINAAMSLCLRNSVKVYPIVSGNKFKIEVNNNGNIKRYSKEITTKELNNAIASVYNQFAIEILKKQKK